MFESLFEEIKKLKTEPMIWIVCLIIPICVNLLIGYELTKGVIDQVPMAVVDLDDSQLSRQIIGYFEADESINIVAYVAHEEELEELFNTSKIRAGMVIPKGFSNDVTALNAPTIMMIYDGSHMSITSIAKAKASEILLTTRVGASIKQIQGHLGMSYDEAYQTAMPISFEYRMLYNPTKNFNYFMTPGYGTSICQVGIGLMAATCVNFLDRERKRREALGYIAGKSIFYGSLGSIALITNIIVQIKVFEIPFRGSFGIACLLSILLAFAVAALSVAVSAWVSNRVITIALIGLLLIPNTVMAGYTWPIISMLPIYQKGAYFIPFTHYGDNLRDLFLKGKVCHLGSDVRFLIGFAIVMLVIGTLGVLVINRLKKEAVA